jgi:hypothetical protein
MPKEPRTPRHKPNRAPRTVRLLLSAVALTILSASTVARPQANKAQTQPVPIPATETLHVYTNLKQVPVLVLTEHYQRMKPLDTSRFRLSLDSGPQFRPTHVRQEGDDPISLAILIDTSTPNSELLPQLSQSIASLVPDYLQPRDHVSIYALDCTLIRTAYDAPANAAMLKHSVDTALAPWQIRRDRKQDSEKAAEPSCKPALPLWDSMSNVIDDLQQQPGRRVLLAITDGIDQGSRTLWTHVMHRAQVESIAVFGLLPTPVFGAVRRSETAELFPVNSAFFTTPEDKFNQVCDLSGGVEVQGTHATLSFRLKEFTKLVRERYILEFPRARDEEAGIHTMEVFYRNRNDLYIVSSGITVPVASEDELKGANTVPSDPSRAPSEGHRKVLLSQP